jgi:hypothetical protein
VGLHSAFEVKTQPGPRPAAEAHAPELGAVCVDIGNRDAEASGQGAGVDQAGGLRGRRRRFGSELREDAGCDSLGQGV